VDWARIGEALVRLLERSHDLEPADLQAVVAQEGERAGLAGVEVMLVDRQQRALRSLLTGEVIGVDGTLAGDAYRRARVHARPRDGDVELAVPLLDGVDRLGVVLMRVPRDGDDVRRAAHAFVALTAELVVSKDSYSDVFELAQSTEEIDLPATLRWALLPPISMRTARVSVAGMLEPAYDIAGDAFDYAVNEDIAHCAVFDAVGHGLRSARLTNLAIGGYRWSRRKDDSIVQTCEAIDRALVDQFGESWFVTALFARLDMRDGTFTWASAGHPMPLLLRRGKVVGELTGSSGLPLGLGGAPPTVAQNHLEPGDQVLLYSDGVTESRDAGGEFFGDARLVDHLERSAAAGLSPAETLRRLVARLLEFQDGPLRDDATLLLVGWRLDPAP